MEPRVSALLLAAGSSRRMGQNKQLLLLTDKPAIRLCSDALLAARVLDIIVVAGRERTRLAEALRDLPVTFVVNEAVDSDMAESVRVGLRSCSPQTTGVLICLSDHPLVLPSTILSLLFEHRRSPEKILIPCYRGRRGHPSLFPFTAARELFPGGTLRDIVRRDEQRVQLLDIADEGVLLDMDTPEDFELMREKARCRT